MKWMILACIAILGAAAAAWSYVSSAVPVQAVRVDTGLVRQYVDERGKTRLPEIYRITMPQAGRIEAIALVEGTPVHQGQVVAQIIQRDLELSMEKASAAAERLRAAIRENDDASTEGVNLRQAVQFVASMQDTVRAAAARVVSGKANWDYAIKSRERIAKLKERGAKSEDDLDLARLAETESDVNYRQDKLVHSSLVSLQAVAELMPTFVQETIQQKTLRRAVLLQELTSAEASLEEMKLDYERGTMKSPVDGVVINRHVTNQRHLAAGQLLLEIGHLEDLEVEADLLSQDAVHVKPGQAVEIYGTTIGDTPVLGTVQRLEPAGFTKISSLGVEQQRVRIVVDFPNEALESLLKQRGLGVDYRVRVRIVTAEDSQALRTARSALFRDAEGHWHVFVVRNGRAEDQPIQVGLQNDRFVEVTEGLSQGDLVVLSPPTDLVNSARVRTQVRK